MPTSTGECYCGDIQYEVVHDGTGVLCNCRTCQIISTDRSFNVGAKLDNLKILKGKPKEYKDDKTQSGNDVIRAFCSNCGTALWSIPTGIPGVVFVKVGALQDAKDVPIAKNIYVESALQSVMLGNTVPDDCKHFEGMMKKEVQI
ncbi:hypothetical protein OIO90_005215 [Microbotryomycetes sp. JL221]|nr:hypothetical protein OIO90_005215 [Microbotryomycetes sp. JL221]